MPTILAFVRLRQENHKFEASLDILLKRERDAERKTQRNQINQLNVIIAMKNFYFEYIIFRMSMTAN